MEIIFQIVLWISLILCMLNNLLLNGRVAALEKVVKHHILNNSDNVVKGEFKNPSE